MTTRRNLCKIKGLSEAKVEKIKEAASKIVPASFTTAKEMSVNREKVMTISTGSKQFDTILGGTDFAYRWSFLTTRWRVDNVNDRGLWRISMRQDSALAYSLYHSAASSGYGRYRRQSCIH